MKRHLWSWLRVSVVPMVSVLAMACGPSSGDSGSKKLIELSLSERADLCADVVEIVDGPRTVQCGDGTSVTLDGSTQCRFDDLSARCEATVDDAKGCAEAQSSDPCSIDFEACAALFDCVFDGDQ